MSRKARKERKVKFLIFAFFASLRNLLKCLFGFKLFMYLKHMVELYHDKMTIGWIFKVVSL